MPAAHDTSSLWFLNAHATIGLSHAEGADGISVIEMRLPFDDAPPLHVHHKEDEVFYILEGEVRFQVDGAVRHARPGETVLAPKGLPHGFRVLSPAGARMLAITHGGFEQMVRAVSRPATAPTLPERIAVPTPEMQARLGAECARRDIELLGPPIA